MVLTVLSICTHPLISWINNPLLQNLLSWSSHPPRYLESLDLSSPRLIIHSHTFSLWPSCLIYLNAKTWRLAVRQSPAIFTIMAILNLLKNRLTLAVVVTSLSVSVLADNNFIAKYGTSPTPFKIDVRPSFINKTVQKVALTRYTVDVEEPDFTSGPPRHNVTTVRDYWLDNYDWYRVQDQLNQRYVRVDCFLGV